MSEQLELTKEEIEAMRVRAMLNGLDTSVLEEALVSDDDIEIEIEDEEEKPAKKKTTRSKSKKETESATPVKKYSPFVEELEQFKYLMPSIPIQVVFDQHDIHYKDQFWGINKRTVNYTLELVKNAKKAKDISDIVNDKSDKERARADKGIVRYYRLVTFEQNVLHKITEIGYVKIVYKDRELKSRTVINDKLLKEVHCDAEKVKKDVVKLIKDMLKQAKEVKAESKAE